MGHPKGSETDSSSSQPRKSRSTSDKSKGNTEQPRQPSIATFFSNTSSSGPIQNSESEKIMFKRKRSLEPEKASSIVMGDKLIKRHEPDFISSGPSVKPARKISIGAAPSQSNTFNKMDTFAKPASRVRQDKPLQDAGLAPATDDYLPDEGEEFVRPPELKEGEDDDDFWNNSSGSDSSMTLRGESVFSMSDSEDEDAAKTHTDTHARKPSLSSAEIKCPLCDKVLTGFSISDTERHVNACLDGDSSLHGSMALHNDPDVGSSSTHFKQTSHTSSSSSISKVKLSDKKSGVAKAKPLGKPLVIQNDAFGALMKGKTEEAAWKLSEQDDNHRKKGKLSSAHTKAVRGGPVNVPFYKIMEGTTIAVDAFKYGKIPNITAYFLSHAHADHYTRLSHTWEYGLIYCSQTTANLICHNLGVKKQWVKPLKNDEPTMVDGVKVTLLDANHCPGSSMFLFEGIKQPQGIPYRYLHCGDFRASPQMIRKLDNKKIDICYLDTTYLNPKYCFPAQEQVINACSDLVKSRVVDKTTLSGGKKTSVNADLAKSGALLKGWLTGPSSTPKKEEASISSPNKITVESSIEDRKPNEIKVETPKFARIFQMSTKPDSLKTKDDSVLVLVGTYTIGKERIVKQIAKAIGSKIYCDTRKSLIFKCIVDDPELHQLMTDDPFKAQVHVTNLFAIKHEMLEEYLRRFRGHFTHIIGLRPTGWTYKPDEISTTVSGLTSIAKVLEMYATSNQSKHIPGGSNTLVNFNQTCLYPQRDSTERCQAFGVPYSEHSSFYELTCFCVSMDWVRIIPTVNCGSPASRAKMKSWFERWQVERKRRIEANLSTFIEPRTESYW